MTKDSKCKHVCAGVGPIILQGIAILNKFPIPIAILVVVLAIFIAISKIFPILLQYHKFFQYYCNIINSCNNQCNIAISSSICNIHCNIRNFCNNTFFQYYCNIINSCNKQCNIAISSSVCNIPNFCNNAIFSNSIAIL